MRSDPNGRGLSRAAAAAATISGERDSGGDGPSRRRRALDAFSIREGRPSANTCCSKRDPVSSQKPATRTKATSSVMPRRSSFGGTMKMNPMGGRAVGCGRAARLRRARSGS